LINNKYNKITRSFLPFSKNVHNLELSEKVMARGKVGFLGSYSNGKPYGTFWLQMMGGGFMHGKFNEEGFASGDDLSFIYPDMSTAFHGTFDNFVMKKGDFLLFIPNLFYLSS
jgi:hypothetical protein